MSLSENGNGMVMPVGPMYGNGGSGSWFGEGGLFWIIILFLFAWMGNGWGNGYGNQAPAVAVNNDIQRGFDQQAIMSELNGVSAALTNGFASAEISRCNAQANSLQAMNNISSSLQQCCCDNRAGLADLKYTVATEACADRQSVNDALRDLESSMSAKTQAILDKMCQDKIDAKNEEIASLRTQLSMRDLAASQNAQTAQIIADNSAQTATLRQALNPTPVPAYVVQNPNGCGCGQNFYGCGCN